MPLKICIFLLISFFVNTTNAQLKKVLKFSTFYVAANGGTSLANQDVYSLDGSKLMYDTIITPYDYSLSMGIRKIQRFQYEGTSQFKDGTENSFSDAANIGRNPFEYLFEIDYRRQEGVELEPHLSIDRRLNLKLGLSVTPSSTSGECCRCLPYSLGSAQHGRRV